MGLIRSLARIVVVLSLCAILLMTSAGLIAYSKQYYAYQFARLDALESTGLTSDGLERVTEHMIAYLKGEKDSFALREQVNGTEQELFLEREIQHMIDVRVLFLQGLRLRVILLCVVAVLAPLSIIGRSWRMEAIRLCRMVSGFASLFCIATVLIGILAATNFNMLFVKFHKIFFTNDLWLLSADAMLIKLLPTQFFINTGLAIGIVFLAMMIVLGVICALITKSLRKSMRRAEKSAAQKETPAA